MYYAHTVYAHTDCVIDSLQTAYEHIHCMYKLRGKKKAYCCYASSIKVTTGVHVRLISHRAITFFLCLASSDQPRLSGFRKNSYAEDIEGIMTHCFKQVLP